MNRFSAYLESAKLAKLYFVAAQDHAKKDDLKKAINAYSTGSIYMLTAINNVASMYFEKRKKR